VGQWALAWGGLVPVPVPVPVPEILPASATAAEFTDLLDLPIEERARLAQAIWDSIAEVPERVQLTESDRQELDRRLASYLENPEEGLPWSEVRSRILGRT